MIRAFIGLPLPEPLVLTCLAAQGHTRSGRPVPRENLHLTLLYLGEQPVSDLESLAADLDRVRQGPVPIKLTGFDVFGAGKDSRLLVATVAPDPALTELQARVVRTARSAGVAITRSPTQFGQNIAIFILLFAPAHELSGQRVSSKLSDLATSRRSVSWRRRE